MERAIFFDRDGVINREIGNYVCRLEDFELLPDAIECIAIARENGFRVFVITNQGGIQKGLYSESDLHSFHEVLKGKCSERGLEIDEIFYCPHHPVVGNCICRKPDSLMLEKAVAKYRINVGESLMIGDTQRDMDAAKKVNIRGVLVQPNEDKISLLKKEIQRITNK